jgi:hypothetical protein
VTTGITDDAVEGGRSIRVGSVIVGLLIIAAKTFLLKWLFDHGRIGGSVILGLDAVNALRRGRPVRASVSFGIMTALLANPGSFGKGVEVAIGAIAALILVSYAIGWVLNQLER